MMNIIKIIFALTFYYLQKNKGGDQTSRTFEHSPSETEQRKTTVSFIKNHKAKLNYKFSRIKIQNTCQNYYIQIRFI